MKTIKKYRLYLLLGVLFAEVVAFDAMGIVPFWVSIGHGVIACSICYAEGLIHEGGHAIAGRRCGVPIQEFRVGSGWRISFATRRPNFRLITVGLCPLGGRVDFERLPISVNARIGMYAAGIVAVMAAGLLAWLIIPASVNWLRVEVLAIFGGASVINAVWVIPKEQREKEGIWSDGQAIRGLWRYR